MCTSQNEEEQDEQDNESDTYHIDPHQFARRATRSLKFRSCGGLGGHRTQLGWLRGNRSDRRRMRCRRIAG